MLTKDTRAAIKAAKLIDAQINAIFMRRCNGLQIPIMQIADIFTAGRQAVKDGRDLEAAVVDTARALDAATRAPRTR